MEVKHFDPLCGSMKEMLEQYETQLDEMVETTLAGTAVCLTDLMANKDNLDRKCRRQAARVAKRRD